MNWQELTIGKNDRAILIGATGCGKTTLAEYFCNDPAKPYSVVYDAKISDNIGNWRNQHFFSDFEQMKIADPQQYPRIVFRPDVYDSLNPDSQDEFFEWVYRRKACRVYVDEAYALLGGTNPSFHLQACLSRGRERGISTIVATQRPKRIPLIVLSEAEHVYIFRLNLMEDKMRVWELTGIDPAQQTTLRNYEFFYFNALSGEVKGKLKLNI